MARTADDARVIAFILDGGCLTIDGGLPKMTTYWDKGHIELAMTWTEIIS